MRELIGAALLLLLTSGITTIDGDAVGTIGVKTIKWKVIFTTMGVNLDNCRDSGRKRGFHVAVNTENNKEFKFYCGPSQVGRIYTTEREEGI